VGPGDFTLAGALYVKYSPLQHALKTQRRLCFTLLIMLRNQWRSGIDKLVQIMAKFIEVGATRTQHRGGSLIIQQCKQQMLNRHELMALGACFLESQIEGDFELSI